MNDESTQRITKTTAVCMLTFAIIIDLAQLLSKILTLLGLTVAGGIGGAFFCNYIGIDAPKFCSVVGAGIGAIVTITGIGTVIALKVGMLMSWIVDLIIGLVGRLVLFFWLQTHGVSIFSGTKMDKKVVTTAVTTLIGFTPFLSTLPEMTIWTGTMIYHARSEDNEKAQTAEVGYNGEEEGNGKNESRMRRPTRRYVRSATN